MLKPQKSTHSFVDSPMTDFTVIQKVMAGDKAIFEILMRRYNNRLFRIARSITHDADEAMDIVQESWLSIYQALNQFRGPSGFASWASRITHNNALMRLRKQQRIDYQAEVIVDEKNTTAKVAINLSQYEPLNQVAGQQLRQLLEQAIDGLPDLYRSVFMMRAIQQLSTQETAASLDLEVDVVKQRFLRSKRLLYRELDRYIGKSGLTPFEFAGERCDCIVNNVLEKISQL